MDRIDELSIRERNNVEETINDLREMLVNTKELVLEGKAATPKMIEEILKSAKEGIINAKIKRKMQSIEKEGK